MSWHVVVPVKASGNAKTRLRTPSPDDRAHAELVRAIQLDTLTAILAAAERPGSPIGRVWVVGDTGGLRARLGLDLERGLSVVDDPGGGLNNAIRHCANVVAHDRATLPDDRVVVIVADLPSLTPDDLIDVLAQAGSADRCFVADRHGTGTTMLAARVTTALDPLFGPDSARRHRESGARELDAPPTARADVDTEDDLAHCLALGLGTHTASAVGTDRRTVDESFT